MPRPESPDYNRIKHAFARTSELRSKVALRRNRTLGSRLSAYSHVNRRDAPRQIPIRDLLKTHLLHHLR